ncbi:hypothetical protein HELRODRAFT_183439 [Helobdella robusta]|uniref:Uncharacterized protein n=1 Tax=Helobdella robusta TaxID=6412 RepID=T1FJN5_HELRO|nr:hypothetical protein HELRODRAFT_183439 [Helobdella robusta]ESO11198.1 hypothetical protein HELRODRAFT_183439 [Helobdella robusta]
MFSIIFIILAIVCFTINCLTNVASVEQRVYHIAKNSNVDVIDVRHNFSTFPNKSNLRTGVRSRISCSIFCSLNKLFVCKGFEFDEHSKECKLVSGFLSGVSASPGKTVVRYRVKEVCPPYASYSWLVKSCLNLSLISFTWSNARDACNNMPLKFHPITLDTPDANLALKLFLEPLSPSTYTSGNDWKIWTSGRTVSNIKLSEFTWQPYSNGTTFSFSGYQNWSSGQPDNFDVNLYGDVSEKNVIKIMRLGRKCETVVRPILIKLDCVLLRDSIMRNVYKFKSLKEFSHVGLNYDLTKDQRQEFK